MNSEQKKIAQSENCELISNITKKKFSYFCILICRQMPLIQFNLEKGKGGGGLNAKYIDKVTFFIRLICGCGCFFVAFYESKLISIPFIFIFSILNTFSVWQSQKLKSLSRPFSEKEARFRFTSKKKTHRGDCEVRRKCKEGFLFSYVFWYTFRFQDLFSYFSNFFCVVVILCK